MKKIAALTAALAVAAPLAIPALASANATTNTVARQYSQQLHSRARVSGKTLTGTTMKCASNGGGYYSCYGTYTLIMGGTHYKYGQYINVTPRRWYGTSDGNLIRTW
jgi:Ni/Co efflux regulator RcnB